MTGRLKMLLRDLHQVWQNMGHPLECPIETGESGAAASTNINLVKKHIIMRN